MEEINKTLVGVLIAGTVIIGGVVYWENTEIPAPDDINVEIQDTGHKLNVLRIVPEEKIKCLEEESFTLNDVIEELRIDEKYRGGRCQEELLKVKQQLEDKLDDEEFQDIPEEERISTDGE